MPDSTVAATFHPQNVTAVILNYKGAGDTIGCLRFLYAMDPSPGRIIVVDNNSGDDSASRICDAWRNHALPLCIAEGEQHHAELPAAVYLQLPENGGYAAGNNAGIRLALQQPDCQAVWILNNDTEPGQGALQALCDRLVDSPGAGAVGSTLIYGHARDTIQCVAGYTFSPWLGTTHPVCGGDLLDTVRMLSVEEVENSLDYICGASVLVPRYVFEHIGFFKEEYFLYYEDVDFGIRVKKAGYSLAWAQKSDVVHKEGGSTKAQTSIDGKPVARPVWVDYLNLRNRAYLIRNYFCYALPVFCLSYLGVIANRIYRGQVSRIVLVVKALFDGLAGRMGKRVL